MDENQQLSYENLPEKPYQEVHDVLFAITIGFGILFTIITITFIIIICKKYGRPLLKFNIQNDNSIPFKSITIVINPDGAITTTEQQI